MKRIFILLSICVLASSCEVNSSGTHDITAHELYSYSSGLIGNFITLPVETTEMLLAFDDYLKMDEDEKEGNTRFYGQIEEVYDNVYAIRDQIGGYIHCTVDTGGKSLREDGAVWTFAELYSANLYESALSATSWYEYTLPAYTTLEATDVAKQVWTMSYEDRFETVMTYKGNDEGRNMWSVVTSGKVTENSDGNQLSAVFNTGDTPVEMKERKQNENEYYHLGNAYSGKFYVETYCGNDKLDFCNLTFRPGFVTKYETGR